MSPKKRYITPKSELSLLDKDELMEKINQLEAAVEQRNNTSENLPETSNKKDSNEEKSQFDFSKCHFRTVLFRMVYIGWNYDEFMASESTDNTVEHHLFHAFIETGLIQNKENSKYYWCGPTETGASCFGQILVITLRSRFPSAEQSTQQSVDNEIPYCKVLNGLLPKYIKVVAWSPTLRLLKPGSTAGFSNNTRTYKYFFPRSSLDIWAMSLGCTRLIGLHDFRNLCPKDVEYTIKEIIDADVLPVCDSDKDEPTSLYYLQIKGSWLLDQQVQCIMGVLLLIGEGKETPVTISKLLDVKRNPRKPLYNIAINEPLTLCDCAFNLLGSNWRFDEPELAQLLNNMQLDWTRTITNARVLLECIETLTVLHTRLCSADSTNADRVMAYSHGLIKGDRPEVHTPFFQGANSSTSTEQNDAKKKKISETDEPIIIID